MRKLKSVKKCPVLRSLKQKLFLKVEDIRRFLFKFVSAKPGFNTAGHAGFEACGEGALAASMKQEPLNMGDLVSAFLKIWNLFFSSPSLKSLSAKLVWVMGILNLGISTLYWQKSQETQRWPQKGHQLSGCPLIRSYIFLINLISSSSGISSMKKATSITAFRY
jgi:hypothetical protein